MEAREAAPEAMASPQEPDKQRHRHSTRSASLFHDRELSELGLKRGRDGWLLDNRDLFYVAHPDDFIRTYDCRTRSTYNLATHALVSHALLDRLLAALAFEAEHAAREAA